MPYGLVRYSVVLRQNIRSKSVRFSVIAISICEFVASHSVITASKFWQYIDGFRQDRDQNKPCETANISKQIS